MFKIKSEVLKDLANQLVKSARKAGVGDKTIYIRTLEDGLVSFYYHGQDISVEKKIPCEVEGDLEVATGVTEFDVKVAALPDDVEIIVQYKDGGLQFLWGNKRKSSLRVDILPETSPMVEVPPIDEIIKWRPGTLHNLVRYIPPFCLNSNSPKATVMPSALGPNFSKDDTGKVLIRATDGVKGVIITANHMDWFSDPMSLDVQTLQGVAGVIPSDAEIEVGLSGGTMVIFKAGYTTAVCRTLIGKFPSIEKFLNRRSKGKLVVDRLELIEVCKRVKMLAPTAALLNVSVLGDKVYAIVPGVLEQALPATVEGDVPSFTVGAIHMEMAALLLSMLKSSDEITLYIDGYDQAITVGIEGREEINLWCLPHISTFAREANSKVTV